MVVSSSNIHCHWTSSFIQILAAYPNGAFAEYVAANAELLLPVPNGWSFEQASQLGVATYTASLCLHQCLRLPSLLSPASEPIDILVWGGAASTGWATIQLAHFAGLRVITTASPENFEFLKQLGADEVLDYADESTPSKIKTLTDGKLKYAVDCISSAEKRTGELISASFGDKGGEIAIIAPYELNAANVQTHFVVGYSLFGKVSFTSSWVK